MSFYDKHSRRNYSRRGDGIDELYAAVMLVAVFACVDVLDVYLCKADLCNARTSAYFMLDKNKIRLYSAWLFVSFGSPRHCRSIAMFLPFCAEVICK
jgi:hypothetical protein